MTIALLNKLAAIQARALGIKPGDIYSPIPEKKQPFITDLSLQKHESKRQGKTHYDLRLNINGIAYSWAIPKAQLPNPGEKKLAIRTFDHDVNYMNFSGDLGKGYGEGKVDLQIYDKVDILECTPGKIKFNLYPSGTEVQQYNLINTSGNNWLIQNNTKTRDNYPHIPDFKPKYKEKDINNINTGNKGELLSIKIDGSHAAIVLEPGKQVEAYSYRESKLNPSKLINHTYKIPELIGVKSPKDLPKMVLRGEIYGTDKSTGKAIPSEQLNGILNSATLKARQKLQNTNMRIALFDVHKVEGAHYEDKPYIDKLKILSKVTKVIPGMEVPRYAIDLEEKKQLLQDLVSGKIKESKEGIVAWKLFSGGSKDAAKIKIRPDTDVVIEEVYAVRNNPEMAGGFRYSLPGSDRTIIGSVGTGFSSSERKDMMQNFDKNWKKRVARVTSQGSFPSGALRASSFMSLHPDITEPI